MAIAALRWLELAGEGAARVRGRASPLRPAINHYNRGVKLIEANRFDEAIGAFRRAADLDPNFSDTFGFLGMALAEAGRLDEAIEAFDRAVQLDEGISVIHFLRGAVLRAAGRSHEATRAFDRVIDLDRDDASAAPLYLAEVYARRSAARLDVGRIGEALADAHYATELDPNNPHGHASAGDAFRKLRRFKEAGLSYKTALRIAWNEADNETIEDVVNSIVDILSTVSYDEGMGNAAHDLNALAADFGYTFEEAAAILTEAAKAASDPLRRARRIVRNFERSRAKNEGLPETPEVVEARSVVNRANYQRGKGKIPTP